MTRTRGGGSGGSFAIRTRTVKGFKALGGPLVSQQQRRHLAAVGADQVLVLDDAEGIDQRLARQAVLIAAIAAKHLQELLQALLRLAGDDALHAQQMARARI